ncbi:MAG: hypothetical protein OQK51_15905 [Kangiellaceae bacterium]|nr:hypothetical protein [Kangiellaceae bacterium]
MKLILLFLLIFSFTTVAQAEDEFIGSWNCLVETDTYEDFRLSISENVNYLNGGMSKSTIIYSYDFSDDRKFEVEYVIEGSWIT